MSHSTEANALRFKSTRWEKADKEIAEHLIPMLQDCFGLPKTIVLRKFPAIDVFAVFEGEDGRKLGECRRPVGVRSYAYFPDVKVSLLARLWAALRLWFHMLIGNKRIDP